MEPPRPSFQDQLLSGAYDPDEELHRVILESRQEYIRQEQQRAQREQQKLHLQKDLAVPVSRLKLWHRTTTQEDEKQCLHHILNLLYTLTNPDRDEDDLSLPPEWAQPVREFLEKHLRPSPLYQQTYGVCHEALEYLYPL